MSIYRSVFILWLLGCASSCWAASCSLSVQGVNFGDYDVFSYTPLESTGNLDVTCDARINYTITLSRGAGSYASRKMLHGTHGLSYNIYRNAARTRILGDGTAGTVVINGIGRAKNYTVYGRIPARQNVYSGSYSDTLVMSVYF